jgi:hypothetical protein
VRGNGLTVRELSNRSGEDFAAVVPEPESGRLVRRILEQVVIADSFGPRAILLFARDGV